MGLVVPDDVKKPDIIVGRNWLVLTEANVVNKLSDTLSVMPLDGEFDCQICGRRRKGR